jgi:hypothetical protein
VNRGGGKELHLWAQIVEAFFAHVTFVASNARFEGHTVTHSQIFHPLADLFNDSGTFMSNDHRFLHYVVSTPQVL